MSLFDGPSIKRLMRIVEAIELRHFVLPEFGMWIEWRFEEPRLRMTYVVPDRDTGKPIELMNEVPVPHYFLEGSVTYEDDEVRRWLHDSVNDLLTHELNEAWHIAGVRVFDPHLPRRPRP